MRDIPCMSVSLDQFQSYYQIKAYDVISAGQYRKHLGQCRDNGDHWAVQLYNKHNTVYQKIRELASLVQGMNNPLSKGIQELCKDVMACAQPPIRLQAGLGTCKITGEVSEHCLDLSRPGKDTNEVLVNNKFWYFFVFLWYCSKLEYIIRSCTKQWLIKNKLKPSSDVYIDACDQFMQANESEVAVMHQLFNKALEYVCTSVQRYTSKYDVQAVLIPPPDFMSM